MLCKQKNVEIIEIETCIRSCAYVNKNTIKKEYDSFKEYLKENYPLNG